MKGCVNMAEKQNKKGFTLIELITVIAIIGILAALLVPSIMNYVKKARAKAAIADAKVIKSVVESALMQRLMDFGVITNEAFDKRLYYDPSKPSEYEEVGAFTSYSWYEYKDGKIGKASDSGSQKVDAEICEKLEDSVSETWPKGSKHQNPLPYNTASKNCAKYCKDVNTNFGIICVYNRSGGVVFMQVYRKDILVSFVKGDWVANMKPSAHFVGASKSRDTTKTWDNIYKDADEEVPEGMENYYIGAYQKHATNGSSINWGLN